MLGHPYVVDVLGQAKTTIDFHKLFREKQTLLLRLSADLSYETKKIIGTALVSELLSAIQTREDRSLFSIFVDEFQTFASFEDFSTLITQAPKLGVATTLVHHERYGQLLEDAKILGATAAIANKVLFQTTARDAGEMAPEYPNDFSKPFIHLSVSTRYANNLRSSLSLSLFRSNLFTNVFSPIFMQYKSQPASFMPATLPALAMGSVRDLTKLVKFTLSLYNPIKLGSPRRYPVKQQEFTNTSFIFIINFNCARRSMPSIAGTARMVK